MRKKLLFVLLIAVAAVAAHGQPSTAYKALPPIYVGGFFSAIDPDYGTNTIDAVGGWVDVPVPYLRIVGVEGEARWGHFHTQNDVTESTYLVGPRVAVTFRDRYTPYVKLMIGSGAFQYPFKAGNDHHTVFAFGGGLDYRLTRRVSIRGDYERQRWSFGNGNINPQTLSAGLSWRFF